MRPLPHCGTSPVQPADVRIDYAGPRQVIVRVSDVNDLPYPGVRVEASAGGGGSVTPSVGVADASGQVTFSWNHSDSGHVLAMRSKGPRRATVSRRSLCRRSLRLLRPGECRLPGAPGTIARRNRDHFRNAPSRKCRGERPVSLARDRWPACRCCSTASRFRCFTSSSTQINFLVPPTQTGDYPRILILSSGSFSADPLCLIPVNLVSPGSFYDTSTATALSSFPAPPKRPSNSPPRPEAFVESTRPDSAARPAPRRCFRKYRSEDCWRMSPTTASRPAIWASTRSTSKSRRTFPPGSSRCSSPSAACKATRSRLEFVDAVVAVFRSTGGRFDRARFHGRTTAGGQVSLARSRGTMSCWCSIRATRPPSAPSNSVNCATTGLACTKRCPSLRCKSAERGEPLRFSPKSKPAFPLAGR